MDIKIKHVYGASEQSAAGFSLQHPSSPDGDDGRVCTATITDAPSSAAALTAINQTVFPSGLKSCNYSNLGIGRIVR
jgi:hypothetical protein